MSRRIAALTGLVVIVCIIVGCSCTNNSESEWPEVVKMMKLLPEDVGDLNYSNKIAWQDLYKEAEWLGLDGATSEDTSNLSRSMIIGEGYCDTDNIFLTAGEFDVDELIELFEVNVDETYEYRGDSVWVGKHYSSILIDDIVITGWDKDIRRCLDVMAGEGTSLYDNEHFRDVIEWLPTGMNMCIWAANYDDNVLVQAQSTIISLENGGNVTKYKTASIVKYIDEDEAKKAVDEVRKVLKDHDNDLEDDATITNIARKSCLVRLVHESTEVNRE